MTHVKYIIQDWASNTLQHNGRFNIGCYGQDLGTPKTFDSFDDGWDWISTNVTDEESHQDLYVEEMKHEIK